MNAEVFKGGGDPMKNNSYGSLVVRTAAMAFTVWSTRLLTHGVRVLAAALVAGLGVSTTRAQELDPAARARIMQARASMVVITAENEAGQTISRAAGFFIRQDLVATDSHVVNPGPRLRVTPAVKEGTLRASASGNYFLPYILMGAQEEVAPLALGDSEGVTAGTRVYALSDSGAISAGTVNETGTVKGTRVFLISLPVDGNNRGAPIFNAKGEVIGIAAESADGRSPGVVFPSSLLAKLKHLGEPGVGTGRGTGRATGPELPIPPEPQGKDTAAAPTSVDTRPVLLSRVKPRYTDQARQNRIQGTVILRVLVSAEGSVTQVRVVRGLPDGLTEQAVEAARQAKFKPALKDGKPVPFWVVLELGFSLY
jgi:TonB family protein